MQDIVIEHREFVALVVYTFKDFDLCLAFQENIKNVISGCSEITRFTTIKAPMLRPNLSIFYGG